MIEQFRHWLGERIGPRLPIISINWTDGLGWHVYHTPGQQLPRGEVLLLIFFIALAVLM